MVPTCGPSGSKLGAAYRYNSGTLASRTRAASGRNLPIFGDPFLFAGIDDVQWIPANTVGALDNPGWGQLDLRLQYKKSFQQLRGIGTEFFMDVFNILNNQDSTRNQDLVAGAGGYGLWRADPVPAIRDGSSSARA